MRAFLAAAVLVTLVPLSAETADSEAERLLDAAIRYHDPRAEWPQGRFRLEFEESRPDGSVRETAVVLEPSAGRFEYASQRAGRQVSGVMGPEGCVMRLDGSTQFSEQEAEEYSLDCDRLGWIRNYYEFLWGLPMKLLDPGTQLGAEVGREEFLGRDVRSLRVTYDPTVGGDIWYFYFDSEKPKLVGYRFFHDEEKGDGEYILLEGEVEGGSMRIPARRTWYTNAEDELLGTDELISIEARP